MNEHAPPTIQRLDLLPVNTKDQTTTIEQRKSSDAVAFVLRGFMTPDECQHYIQLAEEGSRLEPCGFHANIRCADRMEHKSPELASLLLQRIRPYLKDSIFFEKNASETMLPNVEFLDWPKGEWKPIALNPSIRICRYQPGGYFLPHHDGSGETCDEKRCLQTLMVYLNDGYKGGATNFYDLEQSHYTKGDPSNLVLSYQPKAGDALIFFRSITHEGAEVLEGQKYIMRSEIIYQQVLTTVDADA